MKGLIIICFPMQTSYMGKFCLTSCRPKCTLPIRCWYFLIINISGQNASIYLWTKCINIFDFLHGGIHQLQIASDATIFDQVLPGMPSHSQTCLDMPEVSFDSFGGFVRLKIIQNGKLIKFEIKNSIFSSSESIKFQVTCQNMLLSCKIAGLFDHQYLQKEIINVLDFLHEDIYQGRIACKTTAAQ